MSIRTEEQQDLVTDNIVESGVVTKVERPGDHDICSEPSTQVDFSAADSLAVEVPELRSRPIEFVDDLRNLVDHQRKMANGTSIRTKPERFPDSIQTSRPPLQW